MTRETPEPRCLGNEALMLSTRPDDHQLAKAFCAECPAFAWCRAACDQTRRDYPGGVEGTWAGDLYANGRQIGGRSSIGNCPVCHVPDGRPCRSRTGNALGTPHLARVKGKKQCRICNTEFQTSRRRLRYCSDLCAAEGVRRKNLKYDAKRALQNGAA